MKRLMSLLSTASALAILTSCSAQQDTSLFLAPDQQAQQVNTLSVQGSKQFYSFLISKVFETMDKNKDKRVSLDEFKAVRQNFTPGFPSTPSQPTTQENLNNQSIDTLIPTGEKLTDEPPTPTPAPSVAPPNPTPSAVPNPPKPLTIEQIFKKIDKNKDGKLTLTEAENSKYFLGITSSDVRKMVKASLFDKADANKDKNITLDEFEKVIVPAGVTPNPNEKTLVDILFNNGDKNGNGKLDSSEFEDVFFAIMKTSLSAPSTPPVPPTPSQAPSQAPDPAPSQVPDPASPVPSSAPASPVPSAK